MRLVAAGFVLGEFAGRVIDFGVGGRELAVVDLTQRGQHPGLAVLQIK